MLSPSPSLPRNAFCNHARGFPIEISTSFNFAALTNFVNCCESLLQVSISAHVSMACWKNASKGFRARAQPAYQPNTAPRSHHRRKYKAFSIPRPHFRKARRQQRQTQRSLPCPSSRERRKARQSKECGD